MARLPDGFVDEVRSAASIVNIVSNFIRLKQVGNRQVGLCPFHSEKTPSFSVNEELAVYHCFGCGAGGDIYRFIMEHEGLGFTDAVTRVAELSGISIPEAPTTPGDDRRVRLFAINEEAVRLYRAELGQAGGQAAREYLVARGIGAEAIATFELGVTGGGWESLSRQLLRRGYKAADIVAAGLAKERPTGGGIYDRFHQRLVFPIRDTTGRVVGFGGRSLDGREPKYLNSPETDLYRKSDVLYGFNLAREAIRRHGSAVLVEGYLDVIAVHQAGIHEVVASLGTSVTDGHARLVKRFGKRVVIAYDGDAAGQKATLRALGVLIPQWIEVGVVTLPVGQDPDDIVRAEGADGFRSRLEAARGFVPFMVDMVRSQRTDTGTPESAAQVVNEVLPLLALVDDPIERATQVATLAEQAGIDDAVVLEALRRAGRDRKEQIDTVAPRPQAQASVDEGVLLVAILSSSEGAALLDEMEPQDWRGLATAPLFDILLERHQRGEELTVAGVVAELERPQDRDVLSSLVVRQTDASVEEGESALRSMRYRCVRTELSAIQRQIPRASEAELDGLLTRKQQLSRLLEELS